MNSFVLKAALREMIIPGALAVFFFLYFRILKFICISSKRPNFSLVLRRLLDYFFYFDFHQVLAPVMIGLTFGSLSCF
jgi:hypothetical protein